MATAVEKQLTEPEEKSSKLLSDKMLTNRTGNKRMLPTLIVKNHLGKTLDTSTSYQEAIYKARLKVQATGEAVTSLEWRLPHAPLPSRPDYSRTGPPWIPFVRTRHFHQPGAEDMNAQQTVRIKLSPKTQTSYYVLQLR